MLVAEMILPLPVKSNYDYAVPELMRDRAQIGMRAVVTFGRNKMYTGVIRGLREEHAHENHWWR